MLAGARLTILDLSDNAFGPDGVKSIEKLLKSSACFTLQELRLNNCGMGIGGGKVCHGEMFLFLILSFHCLLIHTLVTIFIFKSTLLLLLQSYADYCFLIKCSSILKYNGLWGCLDSKTSFTCIHGQYFCISDKCLFGNKHFYHKVHFVVKDKERA